MSFHVIIPARLESTRLPNKVLLEIDGKPMVQHAYERAITSKASSVTIATDNLQIEQAALSFGAKVCWTKTEHQCGTERIAEAVEILGFKDEDIVINLQSDLPLISPLLIQQTADVLEKNPKADLATLCERIHTREEIFNPNIVKVIRDKNNYALYFSRAPIAWDRQRFNNPYGGLAENFNYYRHIGLYAYRVSGIKNYVRSAPCALEQVEALEQLRVLWNGGRVYVAEALTTVPVEVDTEADLIKVRELIKQKVIA